MMKLYGAVDAAAALGIEPRVLRRFLRNNPSYRSAGLGGRYAFSESELKSLEHAYRHHTRGRTRLPANIDELLDDDPGVSLEEFEAAQHDRAKLHEMRRRRRDARAKRQQRIEIRMGEVLTPRYDDEPTPGD